MFAVFEDGSRQYIVEESDVVRVDFREVEMQKSRFAKAFADKEF